MPGSLHLGSQHYYPYNWDGLAGNLAFAALHSMDTLRVVINKVQ
jgi:hypothetical protein